MNDSETLELINAQTVAIKKLEESYSKLVQAMTDAQPAQANDSERIKIKTPEDLVNLRKARP